MKKIVLFITLTISFFSFNQTVPSYVPTNGLVGWWPFNGNAIDESVNTNDGTVNGATLTTDRFGNSNSAYQFNGTSNNISLPNLGNLTEFSYSIWVKSDGENGVATRSFFGSSGFWTVGHIHNNVGASNLGIAVANNGTNNPVSTTNYNLNKTCWVNITYTYKASDIAIIYINGVEVANGPTTATTTLFNTMTIGYSHNGNRYWNGKIDDLGFWNRVLSPSEVASLHYNPMSISNITENVCINYTAPDGNIYTTSGNYTAIIPDISGCDSTINIDLTVNQPSSGTDVQTACGSYTWIDGNTYTSTTNTPTFVLTNANGCDSTVTLDLTISNTTINQIDTTICIGDSLVLNIDSPLGNSCINMPTNLQNGLVGYWPFCGNANDESGNSNHGTVNGATLTSDRFGNLNRAYDFDGINDYISVSDNPTLKFESQNEFTFSYWINASSLSNSQLNMIISKQSGYGNNQNGFNSSVESSSMANYRIMNGSGTTPFGISASPELITINNWYHVALTYSGTEGFAYINGTLINNLTANAIVGDNSVDLFFGQANWSYPNVKNFNGKIDDISIYNRALTSNEIQDLYTLGNYDINWSTGETTSSINVKPTTTTTYSVTVDDGVLICTDDVTITVNNPQVNAGLDESICDGETLTLSGSGTGITSYTWNNSVSDGVAFQPTVEGYYTVTGTDALGCSDMDSLYLSILQPSSGTDTQTACGSYTWIDGNTYTSTTNTPTFLLTNTNGCDSTVTLDLTITTTNSSSEAVSECSNYTWTANGQTYTQSGQYSETLTNINGCDSTVTLNLTILEPTTGTDTQTACDTYTWIDGNTYTSSTNTPTFVLTNANGCDSTVTLNLTITSSNNGSESINECDSYTWSANGQTYTQSGQYSETLVNINGCDSIATLNLTILPSSSGTDMQTSCNSYTWIDGNTYTTSTNTPTFVLTNSQGCDSTVTLNLTVTNMNSGSESVTECSSYTWTANGQTYTQSGQYSENLTNINGCDSVATLNLTITQPTTGTDIQVACDTYTWIDGNTYTSSTNNPTYTLTNSVGCDSIVTLNLTINTFNDLVVNVPTRLCEGNTLQLLAEGGIFYQWNAPITNGDVVLPTLGVNTYNLSAIDQDGCTSSQTIQVEVFPNPELSFRIDTVRCQGYSDGAIEVEVFNGTPPYIYEWANGSDNNYITELNSGSYSITVSDANNCSVSDAAIILESDTPCFFISEGLSPNGDGINDTWNINGLDLYDGVEIKVYNRWGQIVYNYSELQKPWDGTHNGKLLPSADYYYIILVPEQNINMNGIISLKR